MSEMAALEKRLEALEKRAERAEAWRDCMALMTKYEVFHHPKNTMEKATLFALTMPDVSMEVSCWGAVVGKDALLDLFKIFTMAKNDGVGAMWMHCVDTPLIEVAEDCQTAKGIFFSPGAEAHLEDDGEYHAYWCYGRYTVDFIKENGVWKIWHLRWWRLFRNDFYKSWVDAADETLSVPPFANMDLSELENYKPRPASCFQPYHPNKVTQIIPYHPEPYETWDENAGDWFYGPWKSLYVKDAE